MNDAIRMQISAFVDGELPENEAEMLLRRMSQDAELRQQVADYLSVGRLIRGERSVPGMDRLRDRIAAEVDERPLQEEMGVVESPAPRYVRPLAGAAIAATVTLAAIFGLQQNVFVADPSDAGAASGVANSNVAEEIYTVPGASDEMLREYRLSHGGMSLDLGANGINSRLVSQVREGELIEIDTAAINADNPDEELDIVPATETSAEASSGPGL
jgi:hypothetical protein